MIQVMKLKKFEKKLVITNRILSVILFCLAIYIIATPFIPEIELLFAKSNDKTQGFVYESSLAEDKDIPKEELKPIPKENRVVIPEIGVDSEILEGGDISILNEGQSWRRPLTSNPVKGGNTVVVGHRFFGQGKNTFYHLNKLKKDDLIMVYWEGVEYNYQVVEIFETIPQNIAVESNTKDPILTLYTCSGLSAEKRFIVKAKLLTNT